MKRKYNTYAELAAAFKSGELGKGYYLMLDKGAHENCLSFRDDDLSDEENERRQDECADWFGEPEIEELFSLAGIPAEWC